MKLRCLISTIWLSTFLLHAEQENYQQAVPIEQLTPSTHLATKQEVTERTLYATVYVFDTSGKYCLMMWHKRFGRWMPPGGKIDPQEMPDDTVIRECKEETGIDITLLGNTYSSPTTAHRIQPFGLEHYPSTPYLRATGYSHREAYDFIFMAVADKQQPIKPQEGESTTIRWIPLEEIVQPKFVAWDRIKTWTKFFATQHTKFISQ